MTARALLAATIAATTIATAATPSHAAPWKPKAREALALLNEAIDAAEADDWARAAALSLESYNVAPSLLALWNAGQAQMAIGDHARAADLYDRALGDRDLPRDRRPQLEERRDLARAFLRAEEAATAARWDDARAAYLAILERDGLLPPDRQHAGEALAQLAEQRAAAARAAAAAKSPTEPDPGPSPSSTAPPPGPPVSVRVDQAEPAPVAARGPRWDDTAALVIGGVGVAAVGVGVGLYVHAGQLEDRARAVGTADEDRAGLLSRADGERTAAPIVLGLGAAVLVAGVVKFAIPPDAHRATVATAPTSGGAVVVFGGRF
jgi:tetratricopeptide (TPR) repeat protein